ncbi:MAG TPA: acyltransferase [Rhodopila sp.]|uniref:acyltransferase family protein n=1 Tax=Rhodopila sp. TaxID=2480087 RepID=UPI002C693D12|nr:acyltransferase [Rhodopila sp.]HVY16470.1 acyltransferase [Rhodopila sp.]
MGSSGLREASPPRASVGYVPELDGVRAVAIGIVVAAHFKLIPYIPGGFGVTLFFFLSGYLITTLFFAEYSKTKRVDIPRFYLRRWLRLTPSLVISVALANIFCVYTRTAVGGGPIPIATSAAALFYYTNYFDVASNMTFQWVLPFGVYWSLAIEEHFYLLWPWLVRRTIGNAEKLCMIVVGLAAVVLLWRFIAFYLLGFSSDYIYMATDTRVDSILYGALLRIMFETRWGEQAYRILSGRKCFAAGMLGLLMAFVVRDEGFRQTIRYTMQGICLMPFFTAVISWDRANFIRRILASRPFVVIGQMSYSIYLIHHVALGPGEHYFGSPWHPYSIIIATVLTGLISWSLLVFVDRPLAKLRHRFRTSSSSRGGEVSSVSAA